MRYRGQGWEIPVELPPGRVTAPALGDAFTAAYEAHFGRAIEDLTIEAVSWSVRVSSQQSPRGLVSPVAGGAVVTAGARRAVHDPATGGSTEAGIVERASLVAGERVQGPALIVEDQTTTVLGSHHSAVVAADGTLVIRSETASDARRSLDGSAATDQAAPAGNGAATGEVQLQVMWNRLISIVEEQARTLVRTAFATSVREAGDLSAGVFDRQGRMITQAVTGTPGHVNTMAAAVGHFIADIGPETIAPGDVYITNDPWKGTGHLHDFTVTTPVFVGDDLVGFFASTAHVVDVGGRGWGPDAREVYEEGATDPDHALGRPGPAEPRPRQHRSPQRARRRLRDRRPPRPRRLQRDRAPAPARHVRGVRHNRSLREWPASCSTGRARPPWRRWRRSPRAPTATRCGWTATATRLISP